MEIFREKTDVAYPASAENNAEILRNLNQAISALYALDVGAFSARDSLNMSVGFERLLDSIGLEPGEWAGKLEIARALAFGDSVDWNKAQHELAMIAEEYRMEGHA